MSVLFRRTLVSRLIVAAAFVAVAPVACKKDHTAPQVYVAANDANLTANAAITTAVTGTPFSFPAGGGVISPSLAGRDLVVTFGGTTAAPTATLALGGSGGTGTVTANLTFGSCIFAVTAVTGSVGNLTVGSTITVNPCNLNVRTTGAVANGVATSRSVALVLGAAASAGATVTVGVNPGGQLTLNGTQVGTVTLVPVSG